VWIWCNLCPVLCKQPALITRSSLVLQVVHCFDSSIYDCTDYAAETCTMYCVTCVACSRFIIFTKEVMFLHWFVGWLVSQQDFYSESIGWIFIKFWMVGIKWPLYFALQSRLRNYLLWMFVILPVWREHVLCLSVCLSQVGVLLKTVKYRMTKTTPHYVKFGWHHPQQTHQL